MTENIRISAGFPPEQRQTAAALYYEAFAGKLGKLLGGQRRGETFIASVMDPQFAVAATREDDGKLLGIAGFKTSKGSLVGGNLADIAAIYGWLGALWRAPFLSLLERDIKPGQLLMDGIVVSPEARGLGIGTRLLDAVFQHAIQTGCDSVRLDVIDINPDARRLYERRGFVAEAEENIGPLRHFFGFERSTRMVKQIV